MESKPPKVDSKWAGAFDWNPNKERIVYDQDKSTGANGKGSHISGFNPKNYAKGLKGIDWSK